MRSCIYYYTSLSKKYGHFEHTNIDSELEYWGALQMKSSAFLPLKAMLSTFTFS